MSIVGLPASFVPGQLRRVAIKKEQDILVEFANLVMMSAPELGAKPAIWSRPRN
jgi:hypothetical protein